MFPEYVRLSRDVSADTGFLYDEADVLGGQDKRDTLYNRIIQDMQVKCILMRSFPDQ